MTGEISEAGGSMERYERAEQIERMSRKLSDNARMLIRRQLEDSQRRHPAQVSTAAEIAAS